VARRWTTGASALETLISTDWRSEPGGGGGGSTRVLDDPLPACLPGTWSQQAQLKGVFVLSRTGLVSIHPWALGLQQGARRHSQREEGGGEGAGGREGDTEIQR